MNLFGKILIVVILVASVFFMGMTVAVYSTHKVWKDVVENPNNGLKVRLQQENAKNQELRQQLDAQTKELEAERNAKRQAIAKLETERDQLQQQYVELVKEHGTLEADQRRLTALTDATQQNMQKQLAELTKLRDDIAQIQLDKEKNFDQAVKATDELHRAEGELELLKSRNVQLSEQIAKAKQVLDANNLTLNVPIDGMPPKVDGLVLAINREGLVEISIGADDGLRRGHQLDVFRRAANASKYLGRIEVVRTQPDRAVARILPEYRKGAIQKEDRVATRLN